MEVRVLGPFEARRDGRLVSLGGPREQAVVALLALQRGRAVTAARMIDALWGEDPPKTAVKTLQTYVSRIRRAIGSDVLVTTGGGYALKVEPEDVDAFAFEAAVDAARATAAEGSADRAMSELTVALALWRGEPLTEVAFCEPLAAEAARLSDLRLVAEEERLRAGLAAGRHAELVSQIAALTTENPLRESLWASLMVALYRSGRQADALRAFQHARRSLVDQLGIEPGPELKALEARILAQDRDLAAIPVDHPPPPPPFGTASPLPGPLAASMGGPFAGRALELDALRAAWARSRSGATSIVLLAGEPGIGKSRLAAELAAEAADGGAVVLFGRCDEEQLVPYQPFVEALRHYVRRADSEGRRRLREVASEAIRLVPALAESPNEILRRGGAEPERLALFEGVTGMLGVAASDRPLLIVVDDLHWADRASLLLVRHLVGGDATPALMLLATYRDTELRRDHPLSETLALLRRDPRVERHLITGLVADDVHDLAVAAGLPVGASDVVAAAIQKETGGNPLFVQEVMRHLQEVGWAAGEPLVVPEGVRDVIGRRLARLPAGVDGILGVASVVGQAFDVAVLAAVVDQPDDVVLAALDAARLAGLVHEVPGVVDRFEFDHAMVRGTLYEELGASRRVRVHRAVAAAYERVGTAGSAEILALIAHHLTEAAQATDAARAADYARRAGEAALAQLAFEDAARQFERALDAIELTPHPDAELRTRVRLALGSTLVKLNIGTGAAVLWDAAREAEELGLTEIAAAAACEIVGIRPALGGPSAPEIGLLERALDGLGGADSDLRLRCLSRLTAGLSAAAPKEELARRSGEALAIGRRLRDPYALGEAMVARLFALNLPQEADERLALAGELVRLGREHGSDSLVLHGLRHRASALLDRGAAAAAWAEVDELLALAVRRRERVQEHTARSFIVTRAIGEGRFADAELELAALTKQLEELGMTFGGIISLSHRLVLDWIRGLPLDALAETAARSEATALQEPIAVMADAVAGRVVEATAKLDQLVRSVDDLPQNWVWPGIVFNLGVAAVESGHRPMAATLRNSLEPAAGRMLTTSGRMYLGAVDHHLGLLSFVGGQLEIAVEALTRGLEQHEAAGMRAWAVQSHIALARVLDAVGNHESVPFHQRAAQNEASALGMAL